MSIFNIYLENKIKEEKFYLCKVLSRLYSNICYILIFIKSQILIK